GDAATPIGITTGLLMLAAEPAYAATIVTAGLVDDPWDVDDYLHDLTEITTFGTVDDAMVTIEHAYRDRASFSGVTEHGDYFYGADPGMVEWAHAATTWALLASHQRFSATPLNTAESDEYVRQSARIAHLQGARTSPGSARELEQLLRGSRSHARATTAGRRAAARGRQARLGRGRHRCRRAPIVPDRGRCGGGPRPVRCTSRSRPAAQARGPGRVVRPTVAGTRGPGRAGAHHAAPDRGAVRATGRHRLPRSEERR